MQIIESGSMRIIIPDKGYKIVNKTNGKSYNKVYLGVRDDLERYVEVLDTDMMLEINNIKENAIDNDIDIEILLMSVDRLYELLEPLLIDTMSVMENEDPLLQLYLRIVKKGLKDVEEIPERYKEQVKALL